MVVRYAPEVGNAIREILGKGWKLAEVLRGYVKWYEENWNCPPHHRIFAGEKAFRSVFDARNLPVLIKEYNGYVPGYDSPSPKVVSREKCWGMFMREPVYVDTMKPGPGMFLDRLDNAVKRNNP